MYYSEYNVTPQKLMHISSAIPWGQPQENTTFYGDLLGGFNDHCTLQMYTLQVGKMKEVWFVEALHPGENRTL